MAGGVERPTLSDIWSPRRLVAAWERLLRKHGDKEFDRAELRAFSANPGGECVLLARQIDAGRYHPGPLRPLAQPKSDGSQRLLLVPGLHDRVIQSAVAVWISDTCDTTFADESHGYRPGRSVASACEQVRLHLAAGAGWVVDADIRGFFDAVDHQRLLAVLKQQPWWGHRLASLLRGWLRAEIAPDAAAGIEAAACLCRGLPQGSPLSPVLSNLFLDKLDRGLRVAGIPFVRYADDLVLFAADEPTARTALNTLAAGLECLGLELHPEKTAVRRVTDGFRFLGRDFPDSDGSTVLAVKHSAVLPAPTSPEQGNTSAMPAHPSGSDMELRKPVAEDLAAIQRAPEETVTADPLLRTLYLLESNVRLGRRGDALVVERSNGETVSVVPAARLHQILAFGAVNFNSGAISLCLERGIPVMVLSAYGRHFGVIDPLRIENVPLLRAQFAALDRPDTAMHLARAWVSGKIANSRLMLRRLARRRPSDDLEQRIERLGQRQRAVERVDSPASLRGVEGSAAADYFQALALLLPTEWRFEARRRRPPPDPVNSLLSYGYTVLYYNMLTLLLARGLNPHVGFYHVTQGGKHALVSDMVEEFRAIVVDAVVMDLVLNRRLTTGHFTWPENPGEICLLGDAAKRIFIHALERKLNAVSTPVGAQQALDLRRIMDMQVLQLCAVLQGRSADYKAFMPK